MGESFGVFLLPLSDYFSWDRASVTSIYSIYMFFLGLGSLLSGISFDRYGAKFNYIFGTSLLAIAYGTAGYLEHLWQFYLFLGIMGGIGASMVGIVPSQSILLKWFDKRLSSALSIAYAGQGLGVLFLAPICQILIVKYGWGASYSLIAVCFAVIVILLLFLPWEKIRKGSKNEIKPKLSKLNNIRLKEALLTNSFWSY